MSTDTCPTCDSTDTYYHPDLGADGHRVRKCRACGEAWYLDCDHVYEWGSEAAPA